MSRDASVTFRWADGEHTFRLALGQVRELQEKCDAGPAELFARMFNQAYRVDDLRETIRLGLIGGGMTPAKASTIVERYVDARPLAESVDPAKAILGALIYGVEDEPLGKSVVVKRRGGKKPRSPEEKSGSRPSTDGGQHSATRRKKSTE